MEFDIAYKITMIDSLNKLYSGKSQLQHQRERTKYKNDIKLVVTATLRKYECKLYTVPVFITFNYNSGLDIDNHSYFEKCVIDSLKGILIVNDSRKYVVGRTSIFDDSLKDTVRVKIEEA